jgi:predicted NAD/FAD-binding protein
MAKERIAVIGSGIAGMAAAYYLRNVFDVTLIDKNNYIGGHTNTVFIRVGEKTLPIDTGFMVFNETTYPNLTRLFNELNVTSHDTSMSFGVRNLDHKLEYACSGFSSFFAQRRNLFHSRHWKLYRDILRFFEAAEKLIARKQNLNVTIEDFANQNHLSPIAMRDFILPMAGAIWSTPSGEILNLPALPLLRFMHNHRMLGIGIQLQWKTVENGSEQYKQKLLARLPNHPQTEQTVKAVGQDSSHAYFYDNNGSKQIYDYVIIATHADQALSLLDGPNSFQRSILSSFKYNLNKAILHSDSSVMPLSPKAWASWNVLQQADKNDSFHSSTHYWMNRLQKLATQENCFVSIDYPGSINPDKVYWRATYQHPLFDESAIRAQPNLCKLNRNSRIQFCGSYFGSGFHEDALWSALNVVQNLLKEKGISHEFMPL